MRSLAEQLADEILVLLRKTYTYPRDLISKLTSLALSDDIEDAKSATRAVFTGLVERLADSFEPEAVSLYNRLFSQVIHICRQDFRANLLDHELKEFGLRSEEDLIARAETLRSIPRLGATTGRSGKVQRIIVLSRVTLGADVAITSVTLGRLKREFSGADIVLLGGSKTAELFGGDSRLRIKEQSYGRAGTTISRMLSWTELLDCVRQLTRGLRSEEYMIVDPDTRLTQLGLLPLTACSQPGADAGGNTQQYLFFPSREYGAETSRSLGELTSEWLDEVFGKASRIYPTVSLRPEDMKAAQVIVAEMRQEGRPLIALNFGVGENPLKGAGVDFEASLVARLIRGGSAIVLDKGAGEDETRRADAVLSEVTRTERDGRPVRAVEFSEQDLKDVVASRRETADVLVWNGRVGMLAALIAQTDLYIGYDSAGQHIAAALGVPCIDVFAGFSSRRFVERWRPTGKSEARIVTVDAAGDKRELVSTVLQTANELLKK